MDEVTIRALRALARGTQEFLADHLFPRFETATAPIILALALLVAGLACVLWLFLRKWLPTWIRLKLLEKKLRTIDGELAFARRFPEVDEAFGSLSAVRHGWVEFKQTLILPVDSDTEPVRNTIRPRIYINLAAAETSGSGIHFWQAVPNYFVGVGLLFTFVGLVAAIFFASTAIGDVGAELDSGLAAEERVTATIESLQKLLGAATFKFLTSVAGIISSLAVAVTFRLVADNLQIRFEGLCEALENRMRFVTPEWIAFENFRELKKQTVQLERFNTDLAVSIAEALETKISTSFSNAVRPMVDTLEGMAKNLGDMNQDALAGMVTQFTSSLQQGAGAELQALAGNLSSMQDSLQSLAGQISGAGNQLSSTVSNLEVAMEKMAAELSQTMSEGMSDSMKALHQEMAGISSRMSAEVSSSQERLSSSMMDASSQAERMFQPLQKHIDDFAERMEALSSRLQAQVAAIGGVNDSLGNLVAGAANAASGLREAVAPLRSSSQEMAGAARSMAESGASVRQMQDKLAELSVTIRQSAEATSSSWKSYADRFESIDEDLGKAVAKLIEASRGQQSATASFVKELDEQFSKALQSLGGGVQGLNEGVSDLTEAMEDFLSQLKRLQG